MKSLAVILFAAALFAQTDQKTNKENMVRDRGQTRIPDQSQVLTRGRIGWEGLLPQNELTVSGILVDASCPDRSALNLRARPVPLAAQAPAQPQNSAQSKPSREGGVSAGGVTVDAQTIENERADVMEHQVPDMFTRQEDPTCAVTAATRGYSVLMDDGRLLNMDEGGNTMASEGVMGDARGRAMLNGMAPGFKPRVVVKGWILGDRVIVDRVTKLASRT